MITSRNHVVAVVVATMAAVISSVTFHSLVCAKLMHILRGPLLKYMQKAQTPPESCDSQVLESG